MAGDLSEWRRQVEQRQRQRAGQVIYALATKFQAAAKADYSVPNPAPHHTPAPKGQFPRARTFNLRDAITIDRSLAEAVATGEVRVGVLKSAFYGAALARRGWKGLLDSYRRHRAALARLRRWLGG